MDVQETTIAQRGVRPAGSGMLTINADDWGYSEPVTDPALACLLAGAVSSVSAMVFMEDSGRAAALAREHGVDAGLHLNFTAPFSAPHCPPALQQHQQRCMRFLRSHRLAPVVYHPGLGGSFRYVVEAQMEEFERLYGRRPTRIDGHHHMHLAANVLLAGLLPLGVIIRRNFSFQPGEKSWMNRAYRGWQDRILARRYRIAGYFFSIAPVEPQARIERIAGLARHHAVEIETHPAVAEEFRFLMNGGLAHCLGNVAVSRGYRLPDVSNHPAKGGLQ